MGCGRVGSLLAQTLDADGHSVAVIDLDPGAWRRLSRGFSGQKVTGMGFDRERLIEAGIEHADAFVAVSSGDNSNIITARVAREVFNVKRVVARIYDPRRASVYERLGIQTVATVSWTADQILHLLRGDLAHSDWRDPSGTVALTEYLAPNTWVGRSIADFERGLPGRVAFIVRFGEGLVPTASVVVQEGDRLHIAAATKDAELVQVHLQHGPEAH